MAEQVQAALDQMVAPLKDLLDRGIFSEAEIRSIVSRRREYEYLLRRRAARKADFVRYIESEMALEKLRALRSRKALRKQKEEEARLLAMKPNNEKEKKEEDRSRKAQLIGDIHIIQHVHLLFVRAIRKFKSDVALYLQHAAFCKQVKSFSRLTRIYAEALQMHPKNVGLWIEAASNEYFGVVVDGEVGKDKVVHGGGSVQNARILLQRGLRVNPNSQDLWLQAFGLELHYIQKLRGRQSILFPGEKQHQQHEQEMDTTATTTDDSKVKAATISSSLPLLVYKNAIRAIPNDVTFRLKFVDLGQLFPKESVDGLQQHIMDSIRQDFVSEPSAWIAWATHVAKSSEMEPTTDTQTIGFLEPADDKEASEDDDDDGKKHKDERPQKRSRSSSICENEDSNSKRSRSSSNEDTSTTSTASDPVLNVLTEATKENPTADMFLLSIQFAQSYARSRLHEDGDSHANTAPAVQVVHNFIHQLFERAGQLGIETPELVLEHVRYILSKGSDHANVVAAMEVLESFCKKSLPTTQAGKGTTKVVVPCAIWIQWAELHVLLANQKVLLQVTPVSALDVLRMGLSHIPMTASTEYMILLLHLIAGLIMVIEQREAIDDDDSAYDDELSGLFQQMLILAPGLDDIKAINGGVHYSDWFGPCSIAQVCLDYLHLQEKRKGTQGARNLFHRVLFQQQLPTPAWIAHDGQGWKAFCDECIQVEWNHNEQSQRTTSSIASTQKKTKHQRLDRLYRLCMNLFRETPHADHYKREREDKLSVVAKF